MGNLFTIFNKEEEAYGNMLHATTKSTEPDDRYYFFGIIDKDLDVYQLMENDD